MDLGIAGKVAMVSGASRGIGRAIALGLADEGCRVSVCARGQAQLDTTAREAQRRGSEVLAVCRDVTDEAQARGWVDETLDRFGGVDILVNNVGGSRPGGNLRASRTDS